MKSFRDVLNGRMRTGKGRFVLASESIQIHQSPNYILDLDLGLSVEEDILEGGLVGAAGLLEGYEGLPGQLVLAHRHQLRHRDAHRQQLVRPRVKAAVGM